MEIEEFITQLSSKSSTPGGGGASALLGAISTALCSMVANLTTGKKKYAAYQADIDRILKQVPTLTTELLNLIQKDADSFAPLAKAYGIPKEQPDREVILENVLKDACSVPIEMLRKLQETVELVEELEVKGSTLAVSDVGVAATACRSAMEGAVMNVFINTKLMKDRIYAEKLNKEATTLLMDGTRRCQKVYEKVLGRLQ